MARISKQQLLKLQKTLKTDQAIGRKYRISRQAVHQLRLKYGIKKVKNRNRERNEKIKAMYKKGMTGEKIAKKVGLSISQIYRVL